MKEKVEAYHNDVNERQVRRYLYFNDEIKLIKSNKAIILSIQLIMDDLICRIYIQICIQHTTVCTNGKK